MKKYRKSFLVARSPAALQLKEVCSSFCLRQFILGESTYKRLVFLVGFVLRPI